jgi:GT2 family glycosyltransferase
VIPSWNQSGLLQTCLRSLNVQKSRFLDIVVVDNGSTDDSVEMIKREFPAITLAENKTNLGFAEGTNVGIRNALTRNCEYVFLLNNDAKIDVETVTILMKCVDQSDSDVGIWGVRVVENLQAGSKGWYARKRQRKAIQMGLVSGEVSRVFGCGMLVRTDVFKKIGLFDPTYFAYFEDADLCYRAKKAGFKIYYCAEAKIEHVPASSSGGFSADSRLRAYFIGRNQVRFWRKFGTFKYSCFLLVLLPSKIVLTLLSFFVRPQPTAAFAKIIGYLEGVLGMSSEWPRFPEYVRQNGKSTN